MRVWITCSACLLAVLLGVRWQYPAKSLDPVKKQLIISTDLSAGITGPHGGCAHCNPQLIYPSTDSSEHNFFINYRPQDTDDAMATIMALNHPDINILSIIPVFGNTDLASEMLLTQWLVHSLKSSPSTPVVPGAAGPSVPVLIQPPRLYFANNTNGIGSGSLTTKEPLDMLELFKAGCLNLGVHQMHYDLQAAAFERRRVYLAVLGPATDVACLLLHYPALTSKAVGAVVFLGSQPADEPMKLNDGPAPPDFNVYMDPLAAAVMLHAVSAAHVPLVLMHWTLTSLGTTVGQNILLDRSSIVPPTAQPREAVPLSTKWLWDVQDVRTKVGFEGPNAVPPGPFDQYVIQYIMDPSVFACKPLPVYMQQCSSAPWLTNTSTPFNDKDDCPGHGPNTTARNMQQPAMMLVDLTDTYSGPLVSGEGTLPKFGGAAAVRATVCYNYEPSTGRARFVDSLSKWTW